MRHAALAVLLAATPVAASADDFTEGLLTIQNLVRPAPGRGFQKTDYVKPQRRPALSQLEKEQQDLYDKSLPATFIVRVGRRGQAGAMTGSGYFIHPDGTGMTNAHVAGAVIGAEVELETARGVKKAKVVAVAPGRDIAILKISNDAFNDWPAFTMSGNLRAGALVFAIGNPADQGSTFTRGSVSRPSQDQFSPWLDLLQLDIMLNPGNSGGALIDSSGGLVGMNQMVLRDGRVDGIGGAIPVQDLARAYDEYKRSGKLVDPITSLGVAGDGLIVTQLGKVPAAAGFKLGDAIVEFPGGADAVLGRRPAAFYRAVGRSSPGQILAVRVARAVAAKLTTSDKAGGRANASLPVLFNPATGEVFAPGSPELAGFMSKTSADSVEELRYDGRRYLIDGAAPGPTGMMFKVGGYTPVTSPGEALNLPVEEMNEPVGSAAHGK